jgi:hypothetical protein
MADGTYECYQIKSTQGLGYLYKAKHYGSSRGGPNGATYEPNWTLDKTKAYRFFVLSDVRRWLGLLALPEGSLKVVRNRYPRYDK